jgi:hypothetical protein
MLTAFDSTGVADTVQYSKDHPAEKHTDLSAKEKNHNVRKVIDRYAIHRFDIRRYRKDLSGIRILELSRVFA